VVEPFVHPDSLQREWSKNVRGILLVAIFISLFGMGMSLDESWAQEEAEVSISDPWEPFNQAMFTFNLRVDEYVLRPVAKTYDAMLPDAVQRGVGRFLRNLGVVERFANNLFQGKFPQAGQEVGRFLVNTTAGCAGFLDVAEPVFGWKENPEDFGQTLAVYGVDNGPYLVLPFLGPSTVRDVSGAAVDGALNPMNYFLSTLQVFAIKGGIGVASAVNFRSLNLDLFENVQQASVDMYGAVQDGYVQRREQLIKE
jgi:phospholipid-binding lipoprotein MlaA